MKLIQKTIVLVSSGILLWVVHSQVLSIDSLPFPVLPSSHGHISISPAWEMLHMEYTPTAKDETTLDALDQILDRYACEWLTIAANAINKNREDHKPSSIRKQFMLGYIFSYTLNTCDLFISALGVRARLETDNLSWFPYPQFTNLDGVTEIKSIELPVEDTVLPLPQHLPVTWKPVLYLYPESKTQVDITLETTWSLFYTYPTYWDGWSVTAHPDWTLFDDEWSEYSYLFRDGYDTHDYYDLSKGFVISRDQVTSFLKESLIKQWLLPHEYNEFIVYRAPKMHMHDSSYFLVHFANDEEYNARNPLTITPTPDSINRIYMVFKPLDEKVSVEEQELVWFDRNWFTVVELGGSELRK